MLNNKILALFLSFTTLTICNPNKKEVRQNFIALSNQSFELAQKSLEKKKTNFLNRLFNSKSSADIYAAKNVDKITADHLANSIYFAVNAVREGAKFSQKKSFNIPSEFFQKPESQKLLFNAVNNKTKNSLSKKDCEDFVQLNLQKEIAREAINQMKSNDKKTQSEGRNNFLGVLKEMRQIKPSPRLLHYKKIAADEFLTYFHNEVTMAGIKLPEYFYWDAENLINQFRDSCKK